MHCMAYSGLRHGGEFYAGGRGQWSGGLTFLRYIHNYISLQKMNSRATKGPMYRVYF